jgi:hypothetical protein
MFRERTAHHIIAGALPGANGAIGPALSHRHSGGITLVIVSSWFFFGSSGLIAYNQAKLQ